VIFIDSDDMPRTASGKIIHRKLQERLRGARRGCKLLKK
jgi:acyl-coenzyme A synthetase/AMP-(fatty) acid ligase